MTTTWTRVVTRSGNEFLVDLASERPGPKYSGYAPIVNARKQYKDGRFTKTCTTSIQVAAITENLGTHAE